MFLVEKDKKESVFVSNCVNGYNYICVKYVPV